MKITEFLEGRLAERQAVLKFISRHPEIFEGHIGKDGREFELDEFAVAELDKQYPLAKPVQIIEGVPQEEYDELRAEYIRIQNKVIELQEKAMSMQDKLLEQESLIAKTEAMQLYLADKEQQIEELKAELNAERSKSFFKRLFGRR